jgi:hypothetical protein
VALFPQGKTRIRDRANAGEKRVLDALSRYLEDDYTVWHNIPIMGSGREPDFVVLHPRRGLLILEVKDWQRRTMAQANPMLVELATERGAVTVDHPLAQARGYAQDIVHVLQKQPGLCQARGQHKGRLLLPWGWGAVMSRIKRGEVSADASFADVFPSHKVLLADDLAEDLDPMVFQEKLWGMFQVDWQCQLTLPQLNLVRGILFPELRLDTQMSLPLSPSGLVVRDVLHVMDLQQEAVARGLGEGHRLIHGPAGSGKTMILIFRAVQLQAAARPDKPILVLCYNKALQERIATMLRLKGVGPAVQVRTFHSWALELVRTYQLAPVKGGLRGEDFDALAAVACEGVAASRVPPGQYAAMLIDEAHDLKDEWLTAAAKMVDPASRSLLVLYDDAQSIYQKTRRKLSFAKLGIDARGRTEILKINYRNTREVLSLALECARAVVYEKPAGDGDDVPLVLPHSAGRSGPWPVLRRFENGLQEARFVAGAVQDLLVQGRSPADIAVVARGWRPLEGVKSALDKLGIPARLTRERGGQDQPEVKLTTLHSSKGLEFPVVFLVGLDMLETGADVFAEEIRLLYVGMTRATDLLYLSAARSAPMVDHVAAALERLQPEAATA